ncbi:hypothetical protein ACFYYR_26260 [Streptomyces sp. NPDC001922]|uniref:hypothetical protein n=1 Tax=Streptomyces sp. NPDC001922 TaxID=3364624 RepID=UPI00368956B7
MTGAAVDRTGRPREVVGAFRLSLLAIAVNWVVWVLGAFVVRPTGFDEMRQEVGRQDALVQLAVSAGALLVISGVWLFCLLRMRAGRNWARIVLAAIAALSVLFVLNSLSMDGFDRLTGTWLMNDVLLSDLPSGLLFAAAAALLFLPSSNAYFAAVRDA